MIDPRGLPFEDWAHQESLTLSSFGAIPQVVSETQWADWAASVISIPAIASYAPPIPENFPDWRTWAKGFIMAVPI